MLCIIGPIGCDMQRTTGVEPVGTKLQKRRLYDAAFVVTLLGPRIREVQVDALQRSRRDLLCKHFNGVMRYQSQVSDAGILRREQTVTSARCVYLNTDIVNIAIILRLLYECVPVAETDFENAWRAMAKYRIEIQKLRIELDTVGWPQLLQRTLLRYRQSTSAADEATYGSSCPGFALVGIHGPSHKSVPGGNSMGLVFSGHRASIPA